MTRSSLLTLWILAATILAVTIQVTPVLGAGVAVEGGDQAWILPPAGARIEDYANQGYRLTRRGDEVRVEVDATPLGSTAPFKPGDGFPPGQSRRFIDDPIRRLAWAQTSGATTRYEASSRILGWVSRHIAYHLDRGEPQDARTVLERRRGYCTGISRLTVSLLSSVGIEAREVAGYVVDVVDDGRPWHGYHRWIEIHYPDRGWVFSDPLASHHYVPATYVRLASNQLNIADGLEGLLVSRREAIFPVDIFPAAASRVVARRNSSRQLAAALRVRVDGDTAGGEIVLEGARKRYKHGLRHGIAAFVGLEPGLYEIQIDLPGQRILRHEIELLDRRAEDFRVRVSAP